jgi:hypothetical protein
MTMRGRSSADAATIRRVAAMPSRRGMRTSMITTSGSRSRHRSTAAAPSAASPTTAKSGWVSSIAPKAERTTSWSSTTTMRISGAGGAGPVLTAPAPAAA